MHALMNDTKWDELRLAMYNLGELSPRWRMRDVESGYECPWDGECFYHFRCGGYKMIEWVEIRIDSPEQEQAVHSALKAVHVPARRSESGFKVYGYAQGPMEYIG